MSGQRSNLLWLIHTCFIGFGDDEQAILSLQLLLNSDNPIYNDDALYMIADCYKDIAQCNEALVYYQQLINDYPWLVFAEDSWYEIGDVYNSCLADCQQAIPAYDEALLQYPLSDSAPVAQQNIIKCYYESLGDCESALREAQEGKAKYPESEWLFDAWATTIAQEMESCDADEINSCCP